MGDTFKQKWEQLKIWCHNLDKEELKKVFLIVGSIAITICTIIISIYYLKIMKEVKMEHDFRLAEQEKILKENEALANSKLIKGKEESTSYRYAKDNSRKYSNDLEYFDKDSNDNSSNNSMRNPYSTNNKDENSSSGGFIFAPRKKDNIGNFDGDSERISGEVSGSANDRTSAGTGEAKLSSGGSGKSSKGTKSPQEIKHMIMSDREVMLSNVREKLNDYVGKSGSKYSIINAAKRNIDTRNEYIDYMYQEGLSGTDILEGDNRKDEQLLQDLNKNGRTYFSSYMY